LYSYVAQYACLFAAGVESVDAPDAAADVPSAADANVIAAEVNTDILAEVLVAADVDAGSGSEPASSGASMVGNK